MAVLPGQLSWPLPPARGHGQVAASLGDCHCLLLHRLVVLHAAHLHAHVHEQRPPLRPQRGECCPEAGLRSSHGSWLLPRLEIRSFLRDISSRGPVALGPAVPQPPSPWLCRFAPCCAERAPLLPALHWERAGAHPGGAAGRFPPGPAGARNSSCQEALLSTG